jgi:hypothetical protein
MIVRPALRSVLAVLAVAVASALVVARPFNLPLTGDYAIDAGPPIDALLRGDVGKALDLQPLMGSFSILLRLPFAALAQLGDGGISLVYRFGAFPCVFAGGLLGLFVAREMRRRGQSVLARLALVAVFVLNPMTVFVLEEGHPEEILAAVLCISAVLAAARGRPLPAAIMLGLALATKQWALIALAPVLLAAEGERARILVVSVSIAAVLTLPLLVANPEGFGRTAAAAQGVSHPSEGGQRPDVVEVRPYTVWRLLATPSDGAQLRGPDRELHGFQIDDAVARFSHAAIVLLPIPLSLLFLRRNRKFAREDVLLLLAFLFLLRCILDPINGPYYHVPFILTLAVWEGLRLRGLPIGSIAVSALVVLSLHHQVVGSVQFLDLGVGEWIPVHVFYLSWALPLTAWLAFRLYAPGLLSECRRRLTLSRARAFGLSRSPTGSPV